MITLKDLLALPLVKPRAWLEGPEWLTEGTLAMVFGARGIGKSYVLTALALGLAAGVDTLGFRVRERARVLYVDGEMADFSIQDRCKRLIRGHGLAGVEGLGERLAFFRWSEFPAGEVNITTKPGQSLVEAQIVAHRPNLVVLDNLSALASVEEDNAAASWNGITPWLIKLRAARLGVVLVHHAGKDGTKQRGTSRREDLLDCVVSLTYPPKRRGKRDEASVEDEAPLKVDASRPGLPRWGWDKVRHFEQPKGFEIEIVTEGEALRVQRAGAAGELEEVLREERLRRALRELKQGMRLREAANLHNVPYTTLQRALANERD